jgi:hypothetical protein
MFCLDGYDSSINNLGALRTTHRAVVSGWVRP